MGDWGELMVDILFLIAERIKVIKDFVSFGSVCTMWRAAAFCKGSARSLQPMRLLMFRPLHVGFNTNKIFKTIYSFARDKIRTVSLPVDTLRNQFYTNGWILTESPCDGDMSLIHPFSPHVISLPPKTASVDQIYGIKKAVLSPKPCFFPDGYALMVIYGNSYRLSFWKAGDREWTLLQTDKDTSFKDIIYCRGQFYAVDQHGVIYVCDVRVSNPTVVAVSIGRIPIPASRFYLAGKTDEHSLLLITGRFWVTNSFFKVYELDLIGNGGLKEVSDLGDRTIFVSNNYDSVCVEHSKFPPGIIEADHISFHDFHCSESPCRIGCLVTKHVHKRGMCMNINSLKGGEGQYFFYPLES